MYKFIFAFYCLILITTGINAQNQPNPFHKETLVNYYIPTNSQSAYILVTTIDGTTLGKVTITQTGKGQVTVQAKGDPAGIYHYSLGTV